MRQTRREISPQFEPERPPWARSCSTQKSGRLARGSRVRRRCFFRSGRRRTRAWHRTASAYGRAQFRIRQGCRTRGDRDLHVAPQADESRMLSTMRARGLLSREFACDPCAGLRNEPFVHVVPRPDEGVVGPAIVPCVRYHQIPVPGHAISSPRRRRPSRAVDESVLGVPQTDTDQVPRFP